MRLFILGATGRTGTELVDQGLARGHAVTAFVRSPQKIARLQERLTVIEGNPRDASQLRAALPGHDAVLSALGGPDRPRFLGLGSNGSGPTTICGDCAHSTVRAMQETGVRRLMVVSTAFLFTDFLLGTIVGNLFFRDTVGDAREMERTVGASDLAWTIVRPPQLKTGGRTERYRVNDGHLPPWGFSILRADLAHFMLQEVEDSRHLRAIVGVSR